jgi:hypothetical protein
LSGCTTFVQILGNEERQLLIGVEIDHGLVTEGLVEPDAYGAVHVTPIPRRQFLILVVVANENPDADFVLTVLHHDVADPAVVTTERDPKFQFADAPLPETEGMTEPLGVTVRTGRPHLLPGVGVPRVDALTGFVTHRCAILRREQPSVTPGAAVFADSKLTWNRG